MDTQHWRVPPLPGHGGWMGRLGLQHPVLGQGGTWPLSAFIGSKYGTTAKDQETGQQPQHHHCRTRPVGPIVDPVQETSQESSHLLLKSLARTINPYYNHILAINYKRCKNKHTDNILPPGHPSQHEVM